MENASKALIIAGAILLSILIISLGIMIYNQASGVANNNAMSEVEITQFNSKFTQYEGDSVRGAAVNALLQAVLSNNTAQESNDRKIYVMGNANINMSSSATSLPATLAESSSVYKVKCNYGTTGATKGLIISIQIDKK